MRPALTLSGFVSFSLGCVAGIFFVATMLFIRHADMQFLHADWVLPAAIAFIFGGTVGAFTMVLPVLLATDDDRYRPAIGNNLELLIETSERMANELSTFADAGDEAGSDMSDVHFLIEKYESLKCKLFISGEIPRVRRSHGSVESNWVMK